MSTTQFNSTSFFLSKWAEDDPNANKGKTLMELDIVEDPSTREVCSGTNCNLYYDAYNQEYVTTGHCKRSTFCTETRILKDGLFIETGMVSKTNNCVNHNLQLKNWA